MCVDDGRQPHIVSEMKHDIGGGQHLWPEGKVHLHRSFPSKVGGIVLPGFCHPCLSKGGCFLVDAQVALWSNLLQNRSLQDFHYGGWSYHVQFAMIVIFNFVTIFLSVPLHQQVGRKGGMMNAFWIGLVGGQAQSRWSTIPLVKRIFFVFFCRK